MRRHHFGHRHRVRRGSSKKLRRAFRASLEGPKLAPEVIEWLWELYSESPDEQWLRPQQKDAEDYDPQPWHSIYFRAFDALQYDRFHGALGGEGPIYYTALSQWARDHGIEGAEFLDFEIFLNALDGEWLKWRREKADEEAKRKKDEQARQ